MVWPHETIAANSAVREILVNNSINKDSPSPCNKIMPKAVCGTYKVFIDIEKAELAIRVTEHGIISIIHYFTKIGGQKV